MGIEGVGGESAYTINFEYNSGLSQISKISNLKKRASKFVIFT